MDVNVLLAGGGYKQGRFYRIFSPDLGFEGEASLHSELLRNEATLHWIELDPLQKDRIGEYAAPYLLKYK